jgi:transposase-like protein
LEAEVILGEYAKSGLTQRAFAREIGIGVSTLQYWLRRKGRREPQRQRGETRGGGTSPEVSLLEVDLAGIARGGNAVEERYEIEWANGTRLRVPRGFGKEELRTLVDMVKEGA